MTFIDTHTHIFTEKFSADRAEMIARAREAGAEALLLPCIDGESLAPMLGMAAENPRFCYPMLGLHPTEIPEDATAVLDRMAQFLKPGHPFVAIGEIGLDYYWDDSRKALQKDVFRQQLEWAVSWSLPVSVHSRAAHADVVAEMKPYATTLKGVFHCFGGNDEEAVELIKTFPGFMLGIGGTVTFKKSTLPEVLRRNVPLERIVLETDAPYLSPAPHRGKRNEPSFVPFIAERLAKVYESPIEEVMSITTANAKRIFKLE